MPLPDVRGQRILVRKPQCTLRWIVGLRVRLRAELAHLTVFPTLAVDAPQWARRIRSMPTEPDRNVELPTDDPRPERRIECHEDGGLPPEHAAGESRQP